MRRALPAQTPVPFDFSVFVSLFFPARKTGLFLIPVPIFLNGISLSIFTTLNQHQKMAPNYFGAGFIFKQCLLLFAWIHGDPSAAISWHAANGFSF